MERTKENKTPLRVQGQELSRGERREQRCRPELSADGEGLHLWRECRGQLVLCAESRAASVWSVSRGETFGPGAGRQRLLGVQRAKPFGAGAGRQRLLRCPEGETLGPVGLMLASIHTGLLSGAKHSDLAASPPLATPGTAKKRGTGRRAEWQKD